MALSKYEILDKVWPLGVPMTNSLLTFEEWVVLGADPDYPSGLTDDRKLTLLQIAAEERALELRYAEDPVTGEYLDPQMRAWEEEVHRLIAIGLAK